MSSYVRKALLFTLCGLCAANALAQMPNPCGLPISLESAKKVAAPALAETRKNGWKMAVAVVDRGRHSNLLREDGQYPAWQR